MSNETLRALSRAYAAGNIDRETYRRARRDMLRAVVAGERPLVSFRSPEPETPTVFPYDENDGDTTQEIIPSVSIGKAPVTAGRRSPVLASVIALAVLVGGGFAAYRMLNSVPPATPAPVVSSAPASAGNVFDTFLAGNAWTPDSLAALTAEWDALPAATRSELAGSDAERRFGAALVQQLRAADALYELGETDSALETQGELLDLAEQLGLGDARLGAARVQWRERSMALDAAAASATTPDPATAEPAADEAETNVAAEAVTETDAAPAEAPAAATPPPAAPVAKPAETVSAAPTAPVAAAPAAKKAATPPAAAASAATVAKPAGAVAKSTTRSNCAAALSRTRRPFCIDVAADGTKGPLLVVLPAGRFEMGGSASSEQPRHEVALAAAFAIGMFEVSAAEFALYCKATDASCPAQPWSKPALPVVNVSATQAEAYAAWLSERLGAHYRLPTEAEWEYAARGGKATDYPFGDELLPTHAHYSFKQALREPLPANDRSLNRNGFRLYHIVGNVREWVADAWHADYNGAAADGSARQGGTERVVRGGSYRDAAPALRSAARLALAAGAGDTETGFRLVRVLE